MNTGARPSEVSFVVQGAIARGEPVTTAAVCESIRAHFPGAEIVLSTWQGQDAAGVDCDVLVLSDDPGPLPHRSNANANRQTVGSLAGVRRASRPLVLKTRTDVLFHSDSVLQYWGRWGAHTDGLRVFEARVLTPNVFARKPSLLAPLPMHPSDWCFFGLKSDLEFLFDVPPLTPEQSVCRLASNETAARYVPEQHLWLGALRRRHPGVAADWSYSWGLTPGLLHQTELSLANNLAILDTHAQFGISCPKYADANRDFRDFTLYQHEEWLELYERLCVRAGGAPEGAPEGAPAAAPHEAVGDDFPQWALDDPRIGALRRGGFSWEAQLIECSIAGPTLRRDRTLDAAGDRRQYDAYVAHAAAQRLKRELAAAREAAAAVAGRTSELTPGCADRVRFGGEEILAFPAGRHVAFRARPAKVSVCVPVFNAGASLAQCLDSVLSQQYPDFQVLVVDNGSTDGTLEAACRYAAADGRVLVYRNGRNVGRVPNWNRCLDLAPGDLVKPMLVNDYLLPGALHHLVWAMERYPSVVLARAGLHLRGPDGAVRAVARLPMSMVLPSATAVVMSMTQQNIGDAPSMQILRRDALLRQGLRFDETMQWSADFDLAQRLLLHGDFAYVAEAGVVMDMGVARFATGKHGLLQLQEDVKTIGLSFRLLGAPPDQAEAVVQRLKRECDEQTARTPARRKEVEKVFMKALQDVKQGLMRHAPPA